MKKIYVIMPLLALMIFSMVLLSSCARSVTLYFAVMEGDEFYLAPETRQVKASEDIYKTAIQELIRGPSGDKAYPTIPSDTSVNSVTVSNGMAIVDFDIRIISNFEEIPHSSTTELLAISSIVNTLTEFEDIERVKITIEGKDSGQVEGFYVEDFWGHIGIHEEFKRNNEIIIDE